MGKKDKRKNFSLSDSFLFELCSGCEHYNIEILQATMKLVRQFLAEICLLCFSPSLRWERTTWIKKQLEIYRNTILCLFELIIIIWFVHHYKKVSIFCWDCVASKRKIVVVGSKEGFSIHGSYMLYFNTICRYS